MYTGDYTGVVDWDGVGRGGFVAHSLNIIAYISMQCEALRFTRVNTTRVNVRKQSINFSTIEEWQFKRIHAWIANVNFHSISRQLQSTMSFRLPPQLISAMFTLRWARRFFYDVSTRISSTKSTRLIGGFTRGGCTMAIVCWNSAPIGKSSRA